jgi:hypothetical protein
MGGKKGGSATALTVPSLGPRAPLFFLFPVSVPGILLLRMVAPVHLAEPLINRPAVRHLTRENRPALVA